MQRERFVRWALVALCLALVLGQVLYSTSVYMAEVYAVRALGARAGGDTESAIQYYLWAADFAPGDPELLYLQGNQWSRLGKVAEAKAAYARSLELAPHTPAALIKYAELLALSGEPEAAEESVGRALALAPADWRAVEVAGLVRGVQGDFTGAAVRLDNSRKFSGSSSSQLAAELVRHAELLALSGKLVAARAFVDRGLELVTADRQAEEVAGLVCGMQGDYAKAAVHLARSLELSDNPSARLLNRLAYTQYKLGDFERALGYVDDALGLDALHPDNHLLRGKILLGLDRPGDAVGALESAEREYVRHAATNASVNAKLQETRRYLARAHVARGAA